MAREILPIVANTSFQRIGVVDDYVSFIWTTRYNEPGDFELVVPMSSNSLDFFVKDYYIMRDDDENVGIIERIAVSKDADNQETMIVSGRFLSSILDRRIIAKQTQVSGTVEACVKTLVNQNLVSPSDSARKIANFTYGKFSIAANQMQQQFTGTNLLEAIQGICETYGCGFKVTLNSSNQFVFTMFDGIDRSYNQSANTYAVFSQEYENIESSDYEEDYQDVVTDVLVAGEGEGLDRKTVWSRAEINTGLQRYEVFVDARNASTNNGEISEVVYYQQLKEEGLESITSFTQAFAGEINTHNIEFGADLGIGDICTIENRQWGIYLNARLLEWIESVSEAGVYSVTPTFAPTLIAGSPDIDDNAYILTETGYTTSSETNDALLQEDAIVVSSMYDSAKKISELDEAASVTESHYLAVAESATKTRKLSFTTLQTWLSSLYAAISHKHAAGDITSGTLALARGGSGQTGTTATTTVSTVITAATGTTISSVSFRKWGKVAQISFAVKRNAAVAANATFDVGTLKSGYRPDNICVIGSAFYLGQIGSTGLIRVRNMSGGSVAANTDMNFGATFVLP